MLTAKQRGFTVKALKNRQYNTIELESEVYYGMGG
jgi:hypothetical protein